MSKLEIATLAVGLVLQSLTFADIAPSQEPALNNVRHVIARAEERQDYFPLPDINDIHGAECDPEDDCPRPQSPSPQM